MFKKTIAVGPLEPVESCVTGGTADAIPRRCSTHTAVLPPNLTVPACRGSAARVLWSAIERFRCELVNREGRRDKRVYKELLRGKYVDEW